MNDVLVIIRNLTALIHAAQFVTL